MGCYGIHVEHKGTHSLEHTGGRLLNICRAYRNTQEVTEYMQNINEHTGDYGRHAKHK